METVKRMVLSQWSLLDICICACLLGTDDWSELDSCTKVPSIDGQHWQGIELRRIKAVKEWFSPSGHLLTLVSVLSSVRYWRLIWTQLLHGRHVKWQHWQDIELGLGHCSLIWPFARLETVKRMLVWQRSLHDTCICLFSSVAAWQNAFDLMRIGIADLFAVIRQRSGDNRKRERRIWTIYQYKPHGMWSWPPIADGMDPRSPNGSDGGVAMGKLWPFGRFAAQTLRNPENV